jgi:rhamnogalacturonan endolyase
VAWDWRNNTLSQRWIFDSNTTGNTAHAGQGNHQMTVGDVDADGKDEIFNGSSAINDNGTSYWANGLGHGDALHMTDMDPDRPGQEMWQCHECPSCYGNYGLALKDAKTGVPIWGVSGENTDVGRCNAADIDPRHKGYECWGSKGGLYTCKGVQIGTVKPSMNFSIWWDADLSRELLDGNTISKWDYTNNVSTNLLTATNYSSNNSTKATPSLSADLFGDWREEVIFRKSDNTGLRIYTTNIRSTQKLYTLMHDTQYRLAIAWQNSGYNQPPHPSFYLGTGMAAQTKPNIVTTAGSAAGREEITLGLEETTTEPKVNALLSPNPSSQAFTIKATGKFTFNITDSMGTVVESGKGEDEVQAGLNLKVGLFIVQVITENGISNIKFIKQ